MKTNAYAFVNYVLITIFLRFADCLHGCVSLDTHSFEKIVSKFRASLVKFDSAYPYGKKQEEFEKVCEGARFVDDLLVAEVAVKDYGEKDNSVLAEKYRVQKDDFPVVKLFVQGRGTPVEFRSATEEDFNEENLKDFIRKNSDVYIGLQGCLEEFDKIAESFINVEDVEAKKRLLMDAERLWDRVEGNSDQKSAEVYVKYMRKLTEAGNEFIKNETNRIKNIIKGKVSDNKKEELEKKLNILRAFRIKEEL